MLFVIHIRHSVAGQIVMPAADGDNLAALINSLT